MDFIREAQIEQLTLRRLTRRVNEIIAIEIRR